MYKVPTLPLTGLVDIVLKSGTPKATAVKVVKEQVTTPYDPATDFYKGIREAIIEAHQLGLGKRHITNTAASAHANRISSYTALATNYNGWWGRKTLTWATPPRGAWSPPASVFEVAVNPELGLDINGDKHAIKLYFKAESLSKNRIDIITHLMHAALSPISAISKCTGLALLELRRSLGL
jgi:hypothetical protein